MSLPENYKYASSHEWVSVEGNIATVGITDFAQKELSDVVFVELPELREVNKEEECCVVESVKTASDIYSPLSGRIVQVNEALNDNPGLINSAAHTDGWIFKLEMADSSQLDQLLSAKQYAQSVE